MHTRDSGRSPLRRFLVWAALGVTLPALGVLIAQVDRASPLFTSSRDFAMYWATGRLHLAGRDPYDPDNLLPLERAGDPEQPQAFIMYSPPWVLPLVLPFSLLSYHAGRVLWLLFHAVLLLLGADLAWHFYGGPGRLRWLAWLIGFGFIPSLLMLKTGQVGALLLLGAVGFLQLERRGRDLAAGAAVALLALKPHLVYLFWLALLLWVIDRRRWRVLLGAGLVGLVATLIPLCINPAVMGQYRHAVATHRPTDWVTPTLGTALRLLFGEERGWLQFLPLVPGTAWFLVHWVRHRRRWDWGQETPLLLLVSFLTTCYGAWSHDYVVLLLPVLQVASGVARDPRPLPALAAVAVYLAIDGLIVGLDRAGYADELFLLWMSPVLLLAYLVLHRQHGPPLSQAGS